VVNWVERTLPRLLFTIKASRLLTPMKRLTMKRLKYVGEGVERCYVWLDPLVESPKLGPVLWELPERFHRDEGRLTFALQRLPPGRHRFGFRHPSWFEPTGYALLCEHGVVLVVGDRPERPFQTYELTTNWTFVRFYYGKGAPNVNYSERELEEWERRFAV